MKGSCLCGAVSITAPDQTKISACHCGMCRRWGGGPLMAIHCGPGVEITNADAVTTYRSSEWAERGFCSKCGTHLFYRIVGSSDTIVFAGFFSDEAPFELKEQIFIDSKPEFYEFANATENLTGDEVFAKFAPGD
jgi:hypothetical protein